MIRSKYVSTLTKVSQTKSDRNRLESFTITENQVTSNRNQFEPERICWNHMETNWKQIELIRTNQKSINIKENQSKSDITQLEPNRNQFEKHYLISLSIYIYIHTLLSPKGASVRLSPKGASTPPLGTKVRGISYIYMYIHIWAYKISL